MDKEQLKKQILKIYNPRDITPEIIERLFEVAYNMVTSSSPPPDPASIKSLMIITLEELVFVFERAFKLTYEEIQDDTSLLPDFKKRLDDNFKTLLRNKDKQQLLHYLIFTNKALLESKKITPSDAKKLFKRAYDLALKNINTDRTVSFGELLQEYFKFLVFFDPSLTQSDVTLSPLYRIYAERKKALRKEIFGHRDIKPQIKGIEVSHLFEEAFKNVLEMNIKNDTQFKLKLFEEFKKLLEKNAQQKSKLLSDLRRRAKSKKKSQQPIATLPASLDHTERDANLVSKHKLGGGEAQPLDHVTKRSQLEGLFPIPPSDAQATRLLYRDKRPEKFPPSFPYPQQQSIDSGLTSSDVTNRPLLSYEIDFPPILPSQQKARQLYLKKLINGPKDKICEKLFKSLLIKEPTPEQKQLCQRAIDIAIKDSGELNPHFKLIETYFELLYLNQELIKLVTDYEIIKLFRKIGTERPPITLEQHDLLYDTFKQNLEQYLQQQHSTLYTSSSAADSDDGRGRHSHGSEGDGAEDDGSNFGRGGGKSSIAGSDGGDSRRGSNGGDSDQLQFSVNGKDDLTPEIIVKNILKRIFKLGSYSIWDNTIYKKVLKSQISNNQIIHGRSIRIYEWHTFKMALEKELIWNHIKSLTTIKNWEEYEEIYKRYLLSSSSSSSTSKPFYEQIIDYLKLNYGKKTKSSRSASQAGQQQQEQQQVDQYISGLSSRSASQTGQQIQDSQSSHTVTGGGDNSLRFKFDGDDSSNTPSKIVKPSTQQAGNRGGNKVSISSLPIPSSVQPVSLPQKQGDANSSSSSTTTATSPLPVVVTTGPKTIQSQIAALSQTQKTKYKQMIDYALKNKENIKSEFMKSPGLYGILKANMLKISYITTQLFEEIFKRAILHFINHNYVFNKKRFNNIIIVKMLALLAEIIKDNSTIVTNSPVPAPSPTKGGGGSKGIFNWFFGGKK